MGRVRYKKADTIQPRRGRVGGRRTQDRTQDAGPKGDVVVSSEGLALALQLRCGAARAWRTVRN